MAMLAGTVLPEGWRGKLPAQISRLKRCDWLHAAEGAWAGDSQ